MKSKRNAIIMAICAAVIVLLIVLAPAPKRQYDWSTETTPTKEQPYGSDMVDEFFRRSANHSYETHDISVLPSDTIADGASIISITLDAITEASTDTALLVVARGRWLLPDEMRYSSHDDDDDDDDVAYSYVPAEIVPTLSLLEFARKGGTAMFVEDFPHYYSRTGCSQVLEDWDVASVHFGDESYYYNARSYDKDWYSHLDDEEMSLTMDNDKLTLNKKFAPNYFKFKWRDIKSFNNGRHEVEIRPMLYDSDGADSHAYMIDIYFPKSGGHLYLTPLNIMFANIGLTIPGGPQVLTAVMSKIDDRPVTRLNYVEQSPAAQASSGGQALTILTRNPSLSWAWILILACICCAFLTGLMRRQPVSRGAMADDVDKTDVIAVRESRFRKSPLLHFLFQCSWLYTKHSNHRELFDVNLREVSRQLQRYLNIELLTAPDQEIERAAEYFGRLQERDKSEVLSELQWIRTVAASKQTVSSAEFKRSQQISDNYRQ